MEYIDDIEDIDIEQYALTTADPCICGKYHECMEYCPLILQNFGN